MPPNVEYATTINPVIIMIKGMFHPSIEFRAKANKNRTDPILAICVSK